MRTFTARRAASGPGHRPRGQALAEFAIVFPVFVLLVVAAIDVGRGVFIYNSATNAAREGARLAIVNQDVAAITQRTTNQSRMAEVGVPNVSVEFYEPAPNGDPLLNDECDPVGFGCAAVVTFETTFQPITPIIQNILFPNGVTLRATSIELVEYTCPSATITAANCPKQP